MQKRRVFFVADTAFVRLKNNINAFLPAAAAAGSRCSNAVLSLAAAGAAAGAAAARVCSSSS